MTTVVTISKPKKIEKLVIRWYLDLNDMDKLKIHAWPVTAMISAPTVQLSHHLLSFQSVHRELFDLQDEQLRNLQLHARSEGSCCYVSVDGSLPDSSWWCHQLLRLHLVVQPDKQVLFRVFMELVPRTRSIWHPQLGLQRSHDRCKELK